MRIESSERGSVHTGENMRVRRYGHRGSPVVYVPTSDGDETEFERYGMPEAFAPWIDAGRVQVFSIDGYGRKSLFSDTLDPPARVRAYARFERYAVEELLPWVVAVAGQDDLTIVGPSYGAHVAANLLFKQPDRIQLVCGLGGVYGLWHRLHGFHDDDVYFHTPLEYLPRLDDERILDEIRATRGIDLYAARDDPWLGSTQHLQRVLLEKRLPHTLVIWDSPADHHQSWWRRQVGVFLRNRFTNPDGA